MKSKLAGAQKVSIWTGPDVSFVEAELVECLGQAAVRIPLQAARVAHGRQVHTGEIPEDAIQARRQVRYHLFDTAGTLQQMAPAEEPMDAQPGELHWRNGQFMLCDAGEFLSPPRIAEFHFAPTRFLARRIRVLLPRGYDLNTEQRYPLILAQDGQNLFSPGSHFGSWDMDVTVGRLIRRGEIPEVIVAAIDNTHERHIEFVPEYGTVMDANGRGGEYLAMLRDELLPRLHADFRTIPEARCIAHIGSSLGGLLGFHAANTMKDTFGVVAAMSPSFWVNLDENLHRASAHARSRSRLWIDSGDEHSPDGFERCIKVRNRIIQAGGHIGHGFMHTVGIGHAHRESDWAKRLPDVLKWMFPVSHFHPCLGNVPHEAEVEATA